MRWLKDLLLVSAVVTLLVGVAIWEGRSPTPGLAALIGLSILACLPMLLWRRLPLAAALLSAAVASSIGTTDTVVSGWHGRLVAMTLFCLAVYRRPHRPWLVSIVSVGWVFVYGVLIPEEAVSTTVLADLLLVGVTPTAVGYALRLHRQQVEQSVRLRHAEQRRDAAEDRERLARDVHDSVGHHLTAIRMQATAARRALGGAPPTADRALGTIADLSASALTEVRALLSTLREEPADGMPGLAEVGSLTERLSGPDRVISLARSGSTARLPYQIDQTAYRVIQEALTNAVRHSDATAVDVRLIRKRDRLRLSIVDNGSPRPPSELPAEGQGIRGMRERVRLRGGTLAIGPREPYGWQVDVELPIVKEYKR
ncbi:sensor histidine kinase [Rhizohabitans arisaemae]|uniref:sensor histidine kinase n=1 Tax=Rhizohabitans arisaemae TaxID=2720610 RepID=UPI0024B163F1|nr:sensor histidine kinase [Rhizohabitans arisaemae]